MTNSRYQDQTLQSALYSVIQAHLTSGKHTTVIETRSSAVAERPRDVSYLSVVSFNNAIPPAQSLITGRPARIAAIPVLF